jgi:iron complex outermembrane recepter protein
LLVGLDLSRTLEDEQTRFDFENELPLNIFDPDYGEFARPDSDTLPILINTETEADRLGVYIQDQIQLLNNLILLAGVRYDTVEQRVLNLPTAFEANESDATQTDDAFSPRIGLVYQPLENLSLYASYSQSFVPNSSTTASGDFLEPERGEGFEVGVKAELLDDRLLATLAYYDITKQNIATADPDVLGASIATGEQRSRGIGLDIAGEILPGWNVIAAYAFTDAEVTEDNIIPEGNRVQGVPEHSASLWTTYEIQTGTLQGLGFGLGLYYVGDRAGDPENTFDLGDYFLTNAAIFYRRDNWRAALNIENLFDINYIAGASTSRVRGNDPGEPFRIVGSVSVEF